MVAVVGHSRPSFPAPSEPNLRRLGVGSISGGRPFRVLLASSVAIGVMALAGLLYWIYRPAPLAPVEGKAVPVEGSSGQIIRTSLEEDPDALGKLIELGAVQQLSCSNSDSPKKEQGTACDRLRKLEQEFDAAIRRSYSCAPKTGKEGSINYVLEIDFESKKLQVYPGASGAWRGPQAKRASTCVRQSLIPPDWEKTRHRFAKYSIAILATYPVADATSQLPSFE